MPVDTSCLYTSVKNTSGRESFFGFIPVHGKRLAANEEIVSPGNLITRAAQAGPTNHRTRDFKALERALGDGNLVILNTPAVHLYDDTNDEVKALALDGGVLGSVDPCWGSFSSSL